jgi:threonine dehydrogenase-like Zn-dependent dehydrogenase
MQAVAVYPARHAVDIVDIAEPRIAAPTEVKLRMLEVGVCGTDKDICAFAYGTPPPGSDRFVLGHESLGEVVEAGTGVADLCTGDLVVSTVRLPCSDANCAPCRAGHYDFCMTGNYREHGIKGLDGFMTEFVVEDRHNLHPVARELRDVAVLVEPLTIAEKALIEVREIQQRLHWDGGRQRAVVLGAGPVGLLGAMVMVNAGFETYVYSRSPKPNASASVAEGVGARYISSAETTIEQMAEQVGNIDLIYEAAGAPQFAFEVLKHLGSNGIYVFTGVPRDQAPVEFDTERIMYNLVLKNQVVLGVVNAGPQAFDNAVRDIGVFAARWPQALRAMITGRYPMEAFRDLVMGNAGGIKNTIAIGGQSRDREEAVPAAVRP